MKEKKRLWWLLPVVILLLAAVGWFFWKYTFVDGTVTARSADTIDLRGREISEEKLLRGMADASNTVTLSFEELLYEDNFDDGSVTASESTDSRLMREELRTVIAGAIEGLKEKERQVITLYYYKSMKYSDIAKVIGVSESRVCQINTKAMLSLKAALEPYINGGAVPGKQGAGQEVRS